jgi:hypothetical protein
VEPDPPEDGENGLFSSDGGRGSTRADGFSQEHFIGFVSDPEIHAPGAMPTSANAVISL